jgi:PDZ domain-containing protein
MTMDPRHFEDIDQPVWRTPRWPIILAIAVVAVGVTVLLLWPVKVPYFAMSPGPVEEVADLIVIADEATFASDGELYLLTVGLREVNMFEWVEAQFDRETDLIEREKIRPSGVTQEEVTRRNLESMNESIDTAVFVALASLGYDVGFVGEGAEVLEVVTDSPAEGNLEAGDVVTSVAGRAVSTAEEAAEVIRSFGIGDTITLAGSRGDGEFSTEIELAAHPDVVGSPMVGVVFDTANLELDLPIDVEIDSRNIGGPSAGMMYALTIIDLLTEGDLTKGHRIAGTGTIRFDGTVGPIGGVRQKVFAARGIGAEFVFVPVDNYPDALTAASEDIEIVQVATLQDALDFLDALEPAPSAVASG